MEYIKELLVGAVLGAVAYLGTENWWLAVLFFAVGFQLVSFETRLRKLSKEVDELSSASIRIVRKKRPYESSFIRLEDEPEVNAQLETKEPKKRNLRSLFGLGKPG